MAGRDRALIRLPEELTLVIKRYQNDRRLPTFNAAVVELLETSPAILAIIRELLYAAPQDLG